MQLLATNFAKIYSIIWQRNSKTKWIYHIGQPCIFLLIPRYQEEKDILYKIIKYVTFPSKNSNLAMFGCVFLDLFFYLFCVGLLVTKWLFASAAILFYSHWFWTSFVLILLCGCRHLAFFVSICVQAVP